MTTIVSSGLALVALGLPIPASAQSGGNDEVVASVIRCARVAADAERLRCFDIATNALNRAIATRKIVVIDQARVESERRETFGARRRAGSLPTLEAEDGTKLASIRGILASASSARDNNWVFTLRDGSVWRQTDGSRFAVPPRAGDMVTIKRAALGTYRINVNGQPGVRARRER